MATGMAASEAAQKADTEPQREHIDKGPGSVAGNLTFDPDLRFTGSGRAVCTIRVAYADRIKDENTGKWKDGETVFYDVQAWGTLAEHICQEIQRGDRIVAEGQWQEQSWDDKDGNKQSRVVLVARDLGPSMMFRAARVLRPERTTR